MFFLLIVLYLLKIVLVVLTSGQNGCGEVLSLANSSDLSGYVCFFCLGISCRKGGLLGLEDAFCASERLNQLSIYLVSVLFKDIGFY